ncbi:uncharacterized protein LOC116194252 [Punica granatum]|uniref:Uncharacterized protein n=2 Tax=Punica granatum TaxID=22663 RepID=A0A218XI44_PUNGR|nr:uncharacterized protein LOC116194252 [Punica granatum]OWM84478.1 hypothetical protein CDL15_Pgr000918 [Punica granatum]PKI66110.1 hypothetical protein CRG98_013518 [Punica granatum]
MGRDQKETCEAESSIGEYSSDSIGSSCSSELVEDASSSSLSFACSTSSFSSGCDSSASPPDNGCDGPLYELSKLMAHLPIKRGLSRFYEGKSQSFTSLASVRSIEDLAKEENPGRKRLKLSKSYVEDLDHRHNSSLYSPKSARSNTASRVNSSPFSPSSNSTRGRPSPLALHRPKN